MAQSVDTKIVELKFNNDNFAEKVDSTLTKLEQLNKDIKDVGMTDALKNLTKSAKDVDMSSINDGVKEVHNNFSKMEVVAITALQNITNAAMNLGKKIISSIVSPITDGVIKGGLARARNIEQATFSFEGQKIGKSAGNEALTYYKEVMDAVLGTSYSYDVAAKAASQFAASNVGVEKSVRRLADGSEIETKVLNKDMTTALLGVAGVAAMTGSNFDDIAHIFTKVAGQGKVMNDDLDQLATRGLNARAILGEQLGKTEQEVRDMAKAGDLSFKQFSDAMSAAFGAHAKDSTLIFQGAMDDVQAALARIGADFYGPALNAGRDILNSVTPLVDAIHTKLNPALTKTNNIMATSSKRLSQYLDMFTYMIERVGEDGKDVGRSGMGDWISEHMNAWTNIADLYKRGDVIKAMDELETVSSRWKGMGGEGINGRQMVADYYSLASNVKLLAHYLNISDEAAQQLVDDGEVGFDTISKVIDAMVKDGTIGFNEFYKSFHKLWSESEKLAGLNGVTKFFDDYVRAAIRAEDPSKRFEKHINTFFAIVNGGKSLLKSFGTIFMGLADIFLSLASHLKPLGTLFVQAAEDTAQFVVKLADFIATSKSFNDIIDGIILVIGKFFELLHLNKLTETALNGITKAFDFLAKAIDRVYTGVGKIVTAISNLFAKIVDKIMSVVSSTEALQEVLRDLKNAGIIVTIMTVVGALTKPAEMLMTLSKSIKLVGGSISTMFTQIGDVFKSIAGLAGKIGKALDELTMALKKMQQLIIATAILEIAFAVLVLAGALYVLSKVDAGSAAKNATTIAAGLSLMISLLYAGREMKKATQMRKIWEKSVDSIKGVALALVGFAVAVAILAFALYKLASLDPKKMFMALGAIEALLWSLTAVAMILSPTQTKSTGLKALWSGQKTTKQMTKGLLGLVAVAKAVEIVANALVKVASISDRDTMYQALGVIEAMLWSMAAISKWLGKEKPDKMTKGLGAMIAMAVAVRMLSKPILELSTLAGENNDAMWSAVGAVAALMTVMSILVKTMLNDTKGVIKAGVGIILMAKALQMLSDVVLIFASLDTETMWQSVVGMAVALGSVVLALALVDPDGVIKKAAAFIIIAEALKMLGGVIMEFGTNSDAAWAGIGAAVMTLMLLVGALYAFKKVPIAGILKAFLTLALGAVIVAAFGAAIGVFGVGLATFGIGLSILALGITQASAVAGPMIAIMVAFAIAIGILSAVGGPGILILIGLASAFLLLGIAMMTIGTGLNSTAAAIKILTEMKGQLKDTATATAEFIKNLKSLSKDAESIGESFSTISKPLASIKKSVTTVVEEINKLTQSYSDLIGSTAECMNSLAGSLTRISNLNKVSFTASADAVKGFIDSLKDISGDVETVSTAAQTIATELENLRQAFKNVNDIVDGFKKRSTKVFDAMGQSLESIAAPIQVLADLDSRLESLAADILNFVQELTKMQENTEAVSEAATAISEALNEIGKAAETANGSLENMTQKTANILTQMGDGLKAIGEGVNEIVKAKDKLGSAASAIEDFYGKLETLNSSASTIASATRQVSSAVKTLGSAATKAAGLSKSGMETSGSALGAGLVKGLNKKKNEISNAVTKMLDTTATKAKGRKSAFYSVGSDLISGMVSGIRSQQAALEREVEKMEAAAERAVRAKAKSHSPSRVWIKIGSDLGTGLAIGIAKSGTEVKNASVGLAAASEDAIMSALSVISDDMSNDMRLQPVIAPVVDLTNARNSAEYISSAFSGKNLGLGTGLAASITHTIQNGGKSDMEKSIDDLTHRIGVMTDTMNSRSLNNYITVDGAADPEAFADDLIRGFRLNARMV